MAQQQNPKKPKPKKLHLNSKTAWKDILKQVDKKEVPIQVLEKLNVNLKDGTIVVVDIKKLLAEGVDHEELEQHVNTRLEELDMYIENVDFFVDLEMVEKTVQPETDRLLKKL
jgi:ATP:corrinoid adenosyltransferase